HLGFFASQFTTALGNDTAAPQVVTVSPPSGATGVPVNGVVVIRISEPLNPLTVTAAAVTLSGPGAAIPTALTLSDSNQVLTIDPTANLVGSTTYTVQLNGLRDVAGNALPPFTSTFQTAAAGTVDTTGPTVTAVNPSNGTTGVSLTPVIT